MDRAAVRHNFLALGLDYSCFLIGMSFASQATILPAFAAHLGASNVLIGSIPAVMMLGWFLPSLFAAHHTERLERKLPLVLRYTVWERVPMLALAALALFLAEPAPALALTIFFPLLLVMTATGGALMPAWMDIVGRAIPTTLRGRFFGAATLVASLGGLLGSVVTAWLLGAFAPPRSYGFCFLAGSVFMVLSYVALAATREPAGASPADPIPLGEYLRRMPGLLQRDRNLTWFLVARAFGTLGTMASGFYTVYALRVWQAPEWQVGAFTTIFLAGQVVGNLGLGWLADRVGHRLVLVLGVGALAAGNVVALGAASAEALGPVFAFAGIHYAAIHVSARTILLEFAAEAERPTYIGLTNTALAPLSFAAPLAAGLMADRLGFPVVFAAAAALCAAGVALLLARVREPRLAGQRAT
ncbi:MAG: MFS transporter [Candidatus Rokuibacteriota bacterium]